MSFSNRTSFMTAEQSTPRNSHRVTQDLTNLNKAQYNKETTQQQDSNIMSTQNQSNPYNQATYNSNNQIIHSTSSSISDEIGSSHTVINASSPVICHMKNQETENFTDFTEKVPSIRDFSTNQPELKTYPVAWLLLFFIVVLRAAVSIFNNTFSPIPQVTADFMGISLSSINWLFNVMAIAYIIASCFTSYLYKTIGVKWSLFISGIILSIGCWIRWVAVKIHPPSYPILMIGQALASFSSPISLNITTLFSAIWFTEDKRATAGMFIVSNYGTIIAMFLMPAIATGKDKIELTLIVVACIATVATIPFLFFPEKPPTPASIITLNEDTNNSSKPEMGLKQELKLLIKNPHFIILLIIHSINIALSIAWGGLMNQAITPYGYSDNQVGNIAAVSTVGGTIGCLISGPLIDRTKQHKVLLKIMAGLMCSTYVALIFVVKRESFAAILYTSALNQFFLSFMVPICVELGVEISYPVTESLSTSLLWQISQVLGFILVFVMDLFRDEHGDPKNNMYKGLVFQAIMSGICFAFCIIFNGPLSRTEALKKQEDSMKAMQLKKGLNAHHFGSSDTIQTVIDHSVQNEKDLEK